MVSARQFWRLVISLLALAGTAVALVVLAIVEGRSEGSPRAALLALLAVVVGLATLAIAYSIAAVRRQAGALRQLTDAVDRFTDGDVNARVYLDSRDAVGRLGDTFNRMSGKLADRILRLERDREQLRTILRGMVEGVVALDAGQHVLFANDQALSLLGLPQGDAVSRRFWEVVRQRPLLDLIDRALTQTEPVHAELDWTGAAVRSLTVHAARLSAGGGAVLVLHDTSELRRLERLRQDFAANVSHELKTPLSVIRACVETLLDGAAADPEARGRFLAQIDEQSARLNALILDLLNLARIESGAELFEFGRVDVAEAVEACVERHRARAEARRQTLRLAAGANDLAVWGDAEAVEQILDNLLDNAVKYTPEGGAITVAWHAINGQVALEIADTGVGIPEADLARVFERFYRVDKARSREVGGTGLGLAIVKHLVQAMNGSVRAASRVGKGTTFIVRLPRTAASVGEPAA
jgi:two-component system phosphate regulon sensor histidine kinase PhoR